MYGTIRKTDEFNKPGKWHTQHWVWLRGAFKINPTDLIRALFSYSLLLPPSHPRPLLLSSARMSDSPGTTPPFQVRKAADPTEASATAEVARDSVDATTPQLPPHPPVVQDSNWADGGSPSRSISPSNSIHLSNASDYHHYPPSIPQLCQKCAIYEDLALHSLGEQISLLTSLIGQRTSTPNPPCSHCTTHPNATRIPSSTQNELRGIDEALAAIETLLSQIRGGFLNITDAADKFRALQAQVSETHVVISNLNTEVTNQTAISTENRHAINTLLGRITSNSQISSSNPVFEIQKVYCSEASLGFWTVTNPAFFVIIVIILLLGHRWYDSSVYFTAIY